MVFSPNRQTKGQITIKPARNRTNKTSKAGRVFPKCLTRAAITIKRKAPTTTKQAPLILGEMPAQRVRKAFIKGNPEYLVGGVSDISFQFARHLQACQTNQQILQALSSVDIV